MRKSDGKGGASLWEKRQECCQGGLEKKALQGRSSKPKLKGIDSSNAEITKLHQDISFWGLDTESKFQHSGGKLNIHVIFLKIRDLTHCSCLQTYCWINLWIKMKPKCDFEMWCHKNKRSKAHWEFTINSKYYLSKIPLLNKQEYIN